MIVSEQGLGSQPFLNNINFKKMNILYNFYYLLLSSINGYRRKKGSLMHTP